MDLEVEQTRIYFKARINRIVTELSNLAYVDWDSIMYRVDTLTRNLINFPEFEDSGVNVARALEIAHHLNLSDSTQTEDATFPTNDIQPARSLAIGMHGRPKYGITKEQLLFYLVTIPEIADILCVSKSTIERRLSEFGLSVRNTYSQIPEQDLNVKVATILLEFPNYVLLDSYWQRDIGCREITSDGPCGIQCRIRRRVYCVTGPLFFWHVDGNHKLIRWRLVVHGGIDGYSRMIVYLKCSTNNRAETVLRLFESAVHMWGLPSRVRADYGSENMGIAANMNDHPLRGRERGSFIAGRSIHNTRIERLWRDVFEGVLSMFYNLFHHMKLIGILSPDNEVHIFSLHYIFLPRINNLLDKFSNMWNHHKMRTVGNKSPIQQFITGRKYTDDTDDNINDLVMIVMDLIMMGRLILKPRMILVC
ncbi:uncharacterized protein LOC141907096 [Tubulanus polymorphus]|uniref:uncharacterized protein LOC141907096 n=1 Tax=Tubulanus polymorphus TaxID=672921 RepID=UPI003DA692C4